MLIRGDHFYCALCVVCTQLFRALISSKVLDVGVCVHCCFCVCVQVHIYAWDSCASTHICARFMCKYTHMHEIHWYHQRCRFHVCVQVHSDTHAWDSFMPSALLFLCMCASTHTHAWDSFFLNIFLWYCTILCFWADSLHSSCRCLWTSICPLLILNIHQICVLTALFGCCVSSDATQNPCHLSVHCVHTVQQCTNLQCWSKPHAFIWLFSAHRVNFYIIHQTLTWTTGSLMCLCGFWCAYVVFLLVH